VLHGLAERKVDPLNVSVVGREDEHVNVMYGSAGSLTTSTSSEVVDPTYNAMSRYNGTGGCLQTNVYSGQVRVCDVLLGESWNICYVENSKCQVAIACKVALVRLWPLITRCTT
jgi:hypothetical protein